MSVDQPLAEPAGIASAADDSARGDLTPHSRHKAIDGWRGVAASCVVVAHATSYRFGDVPGEAMRIARWLAGPLAEIGVQVFFVISGFIITSLLLRERASRGTVSIAAFYARRACRILPPLLAYYLVVLLLARAGALSLSWQGLASSATFTCNTGIVACDWWVAHTWSLAVEEQFYLGWPLLFTVLAAHARVRLLALVLGACTVGIALQPLQFHGNFTSFACIATGALYATSAAARRLCQQAAHPLPWLIAAAVVVLAPLTRLGHVAAIALPLLVAYVVFAGNAIGWVRAILESRPLQVIGLGSYSLYLWQQLFLAEPALYAGAPFSPLWLPPVVIASVWLVEKPFIRLGRRLSRQLERDAPA